MKRLCLLFLLFSGCYKKSSYTTQVQYHDNGQAKPKVAVIKVIDSSNHQLGWDLSAEFTELFLHQLFSDAKFYLTDDFYMIETSQLSNLELSPYSEDINWIKETNNQSEFIVFTEILEHKIVAPKTTSYNPLKNFNVLHLSVRLRVLDIRNDTPKIVLQEVISKKYSIPFNFGSYEKGPGKIARNTFALSPLGIAHKSFLAEISKEISDYIIIARSNIYDK